MSIDELLLVKGVTPQLLFGLDAAKMGLASAADSGDTSLAGVDNSDGQMDHGWAQYLTLWSAEGNLRADGSQKIDLNSSDLMSLYNQLVDALDQESAEFIIAYRMGGRGQADASGHLDLNKLAQSSSDSTSGGSASGGGAGGGGAGGGAQVAEALQAACRSRTSSSWPADRPA